MYPIINQFTATATTTALNYVYETEQDHLSIYNNGNTDLIFNVGKFADVVLHPKQTWVNDVDYYSFSIRSFNGSCEFSATVKDYGNTPVTVKQVNEQLAESMQQTKNVQHSKRRPLVTFVSDDGLSADISILKPIFLSYNVPCVTALITSQLNNVAERLDLQNNHGWEVASHGVNHVYLDSLSEANLEIELNQSKQTLENAGFKVKSLVYPFGVHNETVRRVAKKHYRLGVEMGKYPVNKGVIPSFAIARTALGSVFDTVADSDTLAYYKSKVDEAVANNGWCVFMLHSGNTGFNATQQGYLAQTIEYIQSLTVDIVTLNEGYEIFGNALEVGDYILTSNDGFAFSKTGEIGSKVSKLIKNTGLNNASLVTSFPAYCISKASFLNIDNGGFPTSAGTLETSRTSHIEDVSYQLWMPYDSDTIYKRRWASNAWTSWKIIGGVQSSWVGVVNTNTNWTKIGTITATNYIDFVTWYSSGGAQPTLSKKTWALSEISSDSATPTVIGTIGAINVQTYKDANGAIYIKYSTVGNNYPSFFNIAFC